MKYDSAYPALSVIMPSYNCEEYIADAIKSIIDQDFKDFEFIIVNDGSTDKTEEIILSFEDPRIIVIQNEYNIGNYPSRNIGIKRAKGKYIAIMDSDDIALPDRLNKQFNYLENNPDTIAVGTQFYSIGMEFDRVNPLQYKDICAGLLYDNCILHPSLLIRKDILIELNGYNEKFTYASDYDLVCRLSLIGKIENLPDYCMYYRWHKGQISNSKKRKQKDYADEIRQNYQISIINKYRDKNIQKISEEEVGHKDMGRIIGLYVMNRTENDYYQNQADTLLDILFEHTTERIPVCIKNGLIGIGMGLLYLLRNRLVNGDEDKVLDDIDKSVKTSILFYAAYNDFDWKGHFLYLSKRLNRNGVGTDLSAELNLKYSLLLLILVFARSKQSIPTQIRSSITPMLTDLKSRGIFKGLINEIDIKKEVVLPVDTHQKKMPAINVTFGIPVRIDSPERYTNLMVVLDHLLRVENSNIILLEADTHSRIEEEQLPSNVTLYFFMDTDPVFHRTKYINKLLDFSNAEIVGIWDTDVIIPIPQIQESIRQVKEGETTLSLPYDGRCYNLSIDLSERFREKKDFTVFDTKSSLHLSFGFCSFGGAFIVNKEAYKKAGGENENFYGWGPEDLERVMRVRNFGYTIYRVKGPLYHLYHPRNNSTYSTPHIKIKSLQELIHISNMSHSQIEKYVDCWSYNKRIEEDKISVIIPVYNTAPYLDKCLESVINQTYKNLEIILINDASTDNSLDIMKKYSESDTRIRLISHKENCGLGVSRNIGLKIASGKYVLFVDSDDYIDPVLIEKVCRTIKDGFDICIFNAISFEDKTHKTLKETYFIMEESYFNDLDSFNRSIMRIIDVHSACMKMYSLNFLKKNSIEFPENIYGEDVEFWFKCMFYTTKIYYTHFRGYYRRIRSGSIMDSGNKKNIVDRIDNLPSLLSISSENAHFYRYLMNIYIPSISKKVYDSGDVELIEYFTEQLKNTYNKSAP